MRAKQPLKPREIFEATIVVVVALAFFYMIPGALLTIYLVEKYDWAKRNRAWLTWAICIPTGAAILILFTQCPFEGCGIGSDAPEHYSPRPY